jgi:hypothetical protein
MVDVVLHAIPLGDQLAHARTGPQLGRETLRSGPLYKTMAKVVPLLFAQTTRRTGVRLGG